MNRSKTTQPTIKHAQTHNITASTTTETQPGVNFIDTHAAGRQDVD
eukprot:SAG11_NODE_5083_length_1669_cov_1.604459_3_plen_45_part_01